MRGKIIPITPKTTKKEPATIKTVFKYLFFIITPFYHLCDVYVLIDLKVAMGDSLFIFPTICYDMPQKSDFFR